LIFTLFFNFFGEYRKNIMEQKTFSMEVGEKTLSAEFGVLAGQANGSVRLQFGDTVILATATMSKDRREGMDWFPLFVDYEERFYAAGKIKGSRFIKREGRPSDKAVLSGRVIDRTIRPLFDERMRNEIQVVTTVLSIDKETDPALVAVMAASLAIGTSDIPWRGPVGAVRIGQKDGEFTLNPANNTLEEYAADVLVAGTDGKINMIEAGANEMSNPDMHKAISLGFEQVNEICKFQQKIIDEIGKEKTKVELTTPSKEFAIEINSFFEEQGLVDAFYTQDRGTRDEKMGTIKTALKEFLEEKYSKEEVPARKAEALLLFENFLNKVLHDRIINDGERPDGRKVDQVRNISAKVKVLPRTHGSGLFDRGETQALTVATLGSPGDEQIIDTMEVDEKRRYMHHYNFPPFSVGEVRPMRGPGRREIGHGALAEKALMPVLPSKDSFPYTMLLVSEVLSSNGSSSMASTCGSTLALMDAGVPLKNPVSGIAMGIVVDENDNYKILSDIQGPEDHWGDMDFKVAGTKDGITAMQLDVKIDGITPQIVEEVLDRAYESRMQIMDVMLTTIGAPREEMSEYAPRIIIMKIDPDKIRTVIGPGGKVINEIIDTTGVQIDIEDDGSVFITAEEAEGGKKAQEWIKNLTHEPKSGEVYKGKVMKIMDFGAFVEILPGKEGLVHISQLSTQRVEKVEDIVKEGQEVSVRVLEIDSLGRLNLTMKPDPSKKD
jgi:polyribonucleotide nucleotidyltransferase